MKKTSAAMLYLAGLSFLFGVLMKFGIVPKFLLGTVPSTYVQLSQLFLVAAIAVKLCCCCDCKCEKKAE